MFGAYGQERDFQHSSYENELNKMYGSYEGERTRQANALETRLAEQYNAYETERGAQRTMQANTPLMQMQAAALAPALRAMQYNDADKLMQSGDTQRLLQQQYLDSEMNKFNEGRDESLKRLMAYSSILSGATPYVNQSGTTNTQQPYNRVTGALGGGLTGAMLGPMIGLTGGTGALIGGALGLFG